VKEEAATPTVKEETVQGTSDEVSGQLSGLSEPVLLFATEELLRKTARKNGWITRSSQVTCIRFCCGVSIEDEKKGEKGKKVKSAARFACQKGI
jgi:hypothetical protein